MPHISNTVFLTAEMTLKNIRNHRKPKVSIIVQSIETMTLFHY